MLNITYEYQKIKDETLVKYIQDTPSLHSYFKSDFGRLKAKRYCGIVNHNQTNYYILPKIANNDKTNLDIFTYMLIYAYDINIKNEDISNLNNHKSNNIIEALVQLFAKNLLKELKNGIYKKYITKEENLKVLKGRYLINENLKYNFTKDKIYCSYDDFSEDNNLNQFFLFAIKTFLPYIKDKKLLKMCELALDEVTYKYFDIHHISISFDRLNKRFEPSFDIALFLLKKLIFSFENNHDKSFVFLFDMGEIFEKFIGNIYKSIDIDTKLQNERHFGNLTLKPDIICDDLIIDTKYKLIKNKDDLNTQDKYQMFVYGKNFEIKETMLLYPKHLFDIDEILRLGKGDKAINLKMKTIDLYCDDVGYDEYIKVIKDRVGRL
jgi:5-methylcytosine-specific restriction enzyme subunit McrC